MSKVFATEAELVEKFCWLIHPDRWARNPSAAPPWTVYHETAGWDLLLVHQVYGYQIGVEAKLSLNAKVLEQALPSYLFETDGPDFRAVLVPGDGIQRHMKTIAIHLGLTIISVSRSGMDHFFAHPHGLPEVESYYSTREWPNWFPAKRCKLPDYVPDVVGGKPSPVLMSPWKVKAMKLLIILERRGYVTRQDMAQLEISPSRWTDSFNGLLQRGAGGYIRCGRTPDFKSLHPTVWAQIEADYKDWAPAVLL